MNINVVRKQAAATKRSLKKLQKTFDGDSNDAEHDAALDLVTELEALLSELEPKETRAEKARNKKARELARQYESEGDLELDDGAVVSEGDDNGAYVQMWKWVPFEATELCKDKECGYDECPRHGRGGGN